MEGIMSNSLMLKMSAVAVAAGAAVMQMPSAEAQTVAVPVTGGGFVVQYQRGEGAALTPIYTSGNTPTFVTPVGTISVTGTPGLPVWQNGILIQATDTPVGVDINNINGNVSLNDGRNATLTGVPGRLQAIARVVGGNVTTGVLNANNIPFDTTLTVTANFRSGSINVPQAAFSPLPPPQFVIPITNGTFSLNIPANQAAFPVITLNNVITPLGTANLTFTLPASVPNEGAFFAFSSNDADISVVVNGTITLNDGRTANIINRLVTFQATKTQITSPIEPFDYQVASVPFEAYTLVGDFSNFNLSISPSDIISPITSPVVITPPTPSIPTFQLTSNSDSRLTPYIIPDLDDSPLSKRRF
jgi:hypothetical protein